MDALILAGGEKRRFLFHKRLAEIHGKRRIEITSSLLRKCFNKVWISNNSPDKYFYLGLPMTGDIINIRGIDRNIFRTLKHRGTEGICCCLLYALYL